MARANILISFGQRDAAMAFGLLLNDGQASVYLPVARALKRVFDVLKRLGHKVIEWKPHCHKRGVDIKVCNLLWSIHLRSICLIYLSTTF